MGFTLLARTPSVRLGDIQWMNCKNWSNLSQWRNSWELSVWIIFDVSILPLCFYSKSIDTPQGSFSCPCDTGFHKFVNMTGCSDINELTCFWQFLSFLKKFHLSKTFSFIFKLVLILFRCNLGIGRQFCGQNTNCNNTVGEWLNE